MTLVDHEIEGDIFAGPARRDERIVPCHPMAILDAALRLIRRVQLSLSLLHAVRHVDVARDPQVAS